ncbi:hypothetical protein [Chryseobacterium sp. EO14]|uniref:hypothetical protein n=1 Tax=Chryseobacterium sp. EO14 TaxID=2950551 RepID=UPI00210E5116|nr:hypothetical protein [Chryseobacterium sp. EO14]MCQ4139852.1 hypothetical protein [Chryseobacterium sp. EO14]
MIDTIKGYKDLTNDNYTYSDFEHFIENRNTNNDRVSFNLNNFKVTIKFDYEKAVRLSFNGSLPKFYYGNNLAQLDWITLRNAVDLLSATLCVDISDAVLTRVDFGFSFVLRKPITDFLVCISDYPRKNLLDCKTSKKFFSSVNAVSFYDKIKELKSKQKESYYSLPEIIQRSKILRYEIQLKSSLNIIFNKDVFRINDLFDRKIQIEIQNRWINMYNKTNKISLSGNSHFLLEEHNGIYKFLSYHGIEKVQYKNVLRIIESLNFKIKSSSSKKSKMKALVKKIIDEVNNKTNDNNLLIELDGKIKFIKENFFVK